MGEKEREMKLVAEMKLLSISKEKVVVAVAFEVDGGTLEGVLNYMGFKKEAFNIRHQLWFLSFHDAFILSISSVLRQHSIQPHPF